MHIYIIHPISRVYHSLDAICFSWPAEEKISSDAPFVYGAGAPDYLP